MGSSGLCKIYTPAMDGGHCVSEGAQPFALEGLFARTSQRGKRGGQSAALNPRRLEETKNLPVYMLEKVAGVLEEEE